MGQFKILSLPTNIFFATNKSLRLALPIEALFSYKTKGQEKILEIKLIGKDTYPPSPNTRFGFSLIKINMDSNKLINILKYALKICIIFFL